MAVFRHSVAASMAAALAVQSAPAHAEELGNWSIGIERLFGISRTWTEAQYAEDTTAQTSASLFTQRTARIGYSATRVGVDYRFDFGLSLGGAFGYGKYDGDFAYDDYGEDYALISPRVGFFVQLVDGLAVWPRLGLTYVDTGNDTDDLASFTLEAPVVILLPGNVVGVSIAPYAEIGRARGDQIFGLYHTYASTSELGLWVGANAFF